MHARRKSTKSSKNGASDGRKVVSTNRRAWHDYTIDEEFEAGIQLTGTEIKSIREGRVNLRDAFAVVENDELWLIGMHISPYGQASGYYNHEPTRPRKLLLHRDQIEEIRVALQQRGYTLIPLRLALKRGWAKIDLGLAKGKKLYDKRQAIAERDAKRRMEQALRERP